MNMRNGWNDLERPGRRLKEGHISRYGGGVRIEHDGGPLEPGRDLREQLKPLASHRSFRDGETGDVPARAVEPGDDANGDGVGRVRKDDRDRPCLPLEGSGPRGPVCHDDVLLQADQLLRQRWYSIGVNAGPPKVHPYITAIGPTQFRKRLHERRHASLRLGVVFVERHEHAYAPHAVARLRARRDRPRRRAANNCDELPPFHSITSSARASSMNGTSRPRALAVFRLMSSSNLVDCRTGRSVGLAPLRMLPV